jgi:hypothetical protein
MNSRQSQTMYRKLTAKKSKVNPDKLTQPDLLAMLGINRVAGDALVEFSKGDIFNLDENIEVSDLEGLPSVGPANVTKIFALFVLAGRFHVAMLKKYGYALDQEGNLIKLEQQPELINISQPESV